MNSPFSHGLIFESGGIFNLAGGHRWSSNPCVRAAVSLELTRETQNEKKPKWEQNLKRPFPSTLCPPSGDLWSKIGKDRRIMSVSDICWLHFRGPNDPGEDVLERRGGGRQTAARGRPPSPPPRAALLAIMSSAGKHVRLRSPITGRRVGGWWMGGGSPDAPVLWIGSAGLGWG